MSITFSLAVSLFDFTVVRAGRVLLTLYAIQLGARPFAVGVLAATFSALPMLLSMHVGKLSDRFGARPPLLIGLVSGACGMAVTCLWPSLPMLYLAATLNGLSFAFFEVSMQNLVGLQSKPHDRMKNFSNYSLAVSTGATAGPLIAGFSIDQAGYGFASLAVALLSLIPAALLLLRGGDLPRGSATERRPAGSIREILTGSGLWRVVAASCLVVTGIDLYHFYMPIYAHSVGLSASAIGVVLATFSLAAFVVRVVLPLLVRRVNEVKVLVYSLLVGAASYMCVPFFRSQVALALISFVFGLGMGCGQPITTMLTFSNSAEGRSGEVLGLRIAVNHLTRVTGPLLFGLIGSAFGVMPVFWVNALFLASGGAIAKPGAIAGKRES